MHPIVAAGLLAGAMDMTAAMVVYGLMVKGLTPVKLWQGVAQGLLGPAAFEGGAATVLVGLLCHYTIAFGAATAFFLASRKLQVLTTYKIASGVAYGLFVFWFMQLVVVPLSREPQRPFTLRGVVVGMAIHIVCVGLPIAWAVGYFTKRDLAIMQ
jgi:uncharacterized membrane protein YagU involved in acid resistance